VSTPTIEQVCVGVLQDKGEFDSINLHASTLLKCRYSDAYKHTGKRNALYDPFTAGL